MKKHYIFCVQWRKKTIGGMAQRFILCSEYINDERYVFISSKSLLDFLKIKNKGNILSINDSKNIFFRLYGQLSIFLKILFEFFNGNILSLHFAGGSSIEKMTYYLLSILGVRTTVTFASRTLNMASYDNNKSRKEWVKLLNHASKIDVLNPGHDLIPWKNKITVSKCSFPARLVKEIPIILKKENYILFCASFSTTKNPELAIEAIDILFSQFKPKKNWKLIMIGRGLLHQDIVSKSIIINNKIKREVIIFSDENKIFYYMAKSKIFLSLQDYDNYPSQSLMEAMLHNCICIATPDGDTKLMFVDCKGGRNIILEDKNSLTLANAINNTIENYKYTAINSTSINKNHSIENFSKYFRDFTNEI